MLGNSVRDVQRCLTQPKRASSTGTPRARMRPPTTTKRGRCEFNWTLCIRRVRERGSHLRRWRPTRSHSTRMRALSRRGKRRISPATRRPRNAWLRWRKWTTSTIDRETTARSSQPVTVEGIQFTPSGGTLETFRFTDKNGTQWSVPTNIGRLSNVDRQRPNSFIRVGKRYFVHAQVCGSGGNASLISMYDAAVNFGPVR